MSLLRRISGTAAGAAGQIVLGLVASILAARLLGPHGRGELAALLLIPQTLQSFAMLGMPQALAYFTAQQPQKAGQWLGAASYAVVAACLVLALPVTALTPLILHAYRPTLVTTAMATGAVLTLLLAVTGLGVNTFMGLKKYLHFNLFRLAPSVLYLLAVLALFVWPSAPRLVLVYTALCALILVPLQLKIFKHFPPTTPSLPLLRAMAPYALWSLAVVVPQILTQRLDQFAVLARLSSTQLGLYSIALGMGQMLMSLQTTAGAILIPYLADTTLHAHHKPHLFARLFRLTLMLSFLMVAGALVVLPILLPLMFGRAFATAIPPAMLLVAGAGVMGINGAMADGFRGLGWARLPFWTEAFGLLAKTTLLALFWGHLTLMNAAAIGLATPLLVLAANLVLFHTRVAKLNGAFVQGFTQDLSPLLTRLRKA